MREILDVQLAVFVLHNRTGIMNNHDRPSILSAWTTILCKYSCEWIGFTLSFEPVVNPPATTEWVSRQEGWGCREYWNLGHMTKIDYVATVWVTTTKDTIWIHVAQHIVRQACGDPEKKRHLDFVQGFLLHWQPGVISSHSESRQCSGMSHIFHLWFHDCHCFVFVYFFFRSKETVKIRGSLGTSFESVWLLKLSNISATTSILTPFGSETLEVLRKMEQVRWISAKVARSRALSCDQLVSVFKRAAWACSMRSGLV